MCHKSAVISLLLKYLNNSSVDIFWLTLNYWRYFSGVALNGNDNWFRSSDKQTLVSINSASSESGTLCFRAEGSKSSPQNLSQINLSQDGLDQRHRWPRLVRWFWRRHRSAPGHCGDLFHRQERARIKISYTIVCKSNISVTLGSIGPAVAPVSLSGGSPLWLPISMI